MESEAAPNQGQPGPEPGKGRARQALSRYLQRLRKVCHTIVTADEWTELVADLNQILDRYQVEIPAVNRERLKSATQLGEPTRQGIAQACEILEIEIENTIKALPKGGLNCCCLALVALGALVGLLAVGVALAFLLLQPVDVLVVNDGCTPMSVRAGVPAQFAPVLSIFQVDLPETIDTDESAGIEVLGLPFTVLVEGTEPGAVRVSVLGIGQAFAVSSDVEQITVNGVPVLGGGTAANVRSDAPHEVVISCR